MTPVRVLIAIALAALPPLTATAQATAPSKIPVRSLTSLAVSRDTFGAVLNVRQLPGGRVLVNDAKRHKLFVLDSALRVVRVALDSTAGESNSYGTRPEPVIPYLGDSSIFTDVESRSFVLIDAEGNVGRAISAPNDPGIWTVVSTAVGLDDQGRLLYSGLELRRVRPSNLSVNLPGWGLAPISNADSLPLIRGDFRTRAVDTIAALQNLGAGKMVITTDPNGTKVFTTYINPLPIGDVWTVRSDGTIAIVRGQDYHIDWIASDGRKSSTPKLPFDWKRLTDDDKRRVVDSAAIAMAREDSAMQARIRAITGSTSANPSADVRLGRGGSGDPGSAPETRSEKKILLPSDIPDYIPPVRASAARGDLNNNVWILPTTSAQSVAGELVYDVVNPQGELFQRVRVPLGRSIAGFGRNGVVYLISGSLATGFQLERMRVQ